MAVSGAVTTEHDPREAVMMFPDAETLEHVIANLPTRSTKGELILTARPIGGDEAAEIGSTERLAGGWNNAVS